MSITPDLDPDAEPQALFHLDQGSPA